jgi:AAA domain
VSFLSNQRQQAIAERNRLDQSRQDHFRFREKSVLDLLGDTLSTQQQVMFLDEHFRSMPQIIAFSNREFYAGSLKIMTQRPETAELQCVDLRVVTDGKKVRGMNDPEALALVDLVVDQIEKEESLSAAACQSIGVLSPFRDQVDHLSALLQERLSLESMEKHKLMVGTAHTFQGEERDLMFLSLVVDGETHSASFRFLNNPNIFNVSITRARNRQIVFSSIAPENARGDTLLGRYLGALARGPAPSSVPRSRFQDEFVTEVRGELQRQGFRTWAAYPVAGIEIDLVIERSGRTLGIDLIGYPGKFSVLLDPERYRMFQRAGLALFPLSYRCWQKDRPASLEAICRWHEALESGSDRG